MRSITTLRRASRKVASLAPVSLAATAVLLALAASVCAAGPAAAQAAISAAGTLESTAGGFLFPDGTL